MWRLLTLGGLALQSPARPGAGASLQGLAILARVAAARERGLTRAKLAGCFWPERDERHARHLLSQALHQLRKELGTGAPILGTEVLRLNAQLVSSDVVELQDALARRDAERAAALYAGPFLDGIFLNRADEFERWAESERRRLATAFVRGLREAAAAAAASGDHAAAAAWWRRAAAADPLDSTVALELVRELAASGDAASALREARVHETVVRTELGGEPDARVQALVEQLRQAKPPERATAALHTRSADHRTRASQQALTVEELCARARQCIQRMDGPSYAEAVRYLERAVQADPGHAGARVTLGSLYILLSQADTAGDPSGKGVAHCRRAAALDPELAEAPLWLGVAEMLEDRFEEAERLALRALALDHGGHFSQFVLGWIRVAHGFRTGCWGKCVEGAIALRRSLELEPRGQYSLMILSSVYTLAGQYDVASGLLERAVGVEHTPAGETHMIGAMTLLGLVRLRQGRDADARTWLDRAAAAYASAPQLFAPYVQALTLGGLGDLERMAGRYDEALAYLVRAREALDPMPSLCGSGYLVVRFELRLAGVCRRLRMRPEETRHAAAAQAVLDARGPNRFNWCWFVSEGELHYDRAVYYATCADRAATLDALGRARASGWQEVPLLELEPAFDFCRADPELKLLREDVRRAAPLPA